MVILPRRPHRRGGHPKLWAFGYPELAALFGMSLPATRQAVSRERVDPADLANLVAFAARDRGWSVLPLDGLVAREVARARRAGRSATLTTRQWLEALAHFDGRCAFCGAAREIGIDLFVPPEFGGGATRDNCVPACGACHRRKGWRSPREAIAVFGRDVVERVAAFLQVDVHTTAARPLPDRVPPAAPEQLEAIAREAGLAVSSVRTYTCRRGGRPPILNPHDPDSVQALIERSRRRKVPR